VAQTCVRWFERGHGIRVVCRNVGFLDRSRCIIISRLVSLPLLTFVNRSAVSSIITRDRFGLHVLPPRQGARQRQAAASRARVALEASLHLAIGEPIMVLDLTRMCSMTQGPDTQYLAIDGQESFDALVQKLSV